MSSDERSSGEQYPGPEPSRSSEQPSDSEAAPGESGGRRDSEPVGGADETVVVGEAVASFGLRLGRRDAATEKDERSSRKNAEDEGWGTRPESDGPAKP
jgi:hypothetical protein